MNIRVLVADAISEEGLAPLQQNPGFSVQVKTGLKGADLLREVSGCDALLVRSETKVNAEVIGAAAGLRFIGRAGTGVDNIDLGAASRQGIVVANVPGGNTISAAEQTLALLFAMARNIPRADASTRAGKWERSKFVGTEITGKTLGVVGLGRIGREVATRAIGLSMRVIAFDPMGDESWCRRAGIAFVSLDELLAQSDFITVHVPLSDQTRGLLNRDTFAKTKKGVRVINCARGGIIDEKALLEFVENGHVKGAALDVFEKEPLDPQSPLLKRPEIIVTPHLGASTEEAQVKVAVELSQSLVEFFENGFAKQAVNLPPLDVAGQNQLLSFIGLAHKQGAFLAQFAGAAATSLTLRYSGELARVNPSLYTATAVAGFLAALGEKATPVNALLLAQQRGLRVQEQVQPEAKDYASLLEMEAETPEGSHQLAGTVYGRGDTRFVRIDGLAVDVTPHKYLLVMTNEDRPGVVGHTGTVLSAAGINIAGMDIARNRPGGVAVSLWSVDSPVPAEVLAKVKAFAPILSVKMVQL
ncbi:MAG TPA: phosphoglycerate dehydrogenase [Elusimicrobiota bacterium]|jgi:D-3-phosphoglycerate dehydrogenase|nr:phosphoglycerate dehydrogenase [Elusimicrobiota bacterium]HMX43155.1 phosphoglycerate dehydrogenase [Elusimicrobiota bacterium]HMZ26271.1 phosphoglycerate dehydrogenase [Elusimicrobiota bacterium]HNA59976.1 phosphoglycerate dehydrogenase [Elusimicrobiota bacterium]HND63309.1 phosphoglycerate dehydrogenase [Elusimicrobiota bacterium]